MVASGGVDFFLAGTQRRIAKGALVGVHAWSDGFNSATDLADDDPAHQSYLDFYKTVGIDPQFYWYTLDAAPADDMHWMTDDELRRFSIATQ